MTSSVVEDPLPVKTGHTTHGEVQTLAFGGEGIIRHQNFVVFVPFSLPGDTIEFTVTETKKTFARGKLNQIIRPSKDRIKAPCPIYFTCGGCQLQEMNYQAAVKTKSNILEELLRIKLGLKEIPMEPPLSSPQPYAYRNKMQLAVGEDSQGVLLLGLFASNTHLIVDMPACPIQEEANNQVLKVIREGIKLAGWRPYHEAEGSGQIRYFLARTNRKGEVYPVVVSTKADLPNLEKFLDFLRHSISLLTGFAVNLNPAKTNTILGEKTNVIWGKDYLEEKIGSFRYRFGPTTFFQVNSSILSFLIPKILEWSDVEKLESVLDLYCGVGTFTIPFAKQAKEVIGIEENEEAVKWGKQNSNLNELNNVQFIGGKAEAVLSTLPEEKFQITFMDPPRRGLHPKVLKELVRLNPKKILYLSCNPPTLARDLLFLQQSGWKLTKALAADLFPQTSHIEALVLMEK